MNAGVRTFLAVLLYAAGICAIEAFLYSRTHALWLCETSVAVLALLAIVTRFVPAWSVHLARESGFIQMPFVLAACDGTASPVKFAVFCAGTIVAWAAIVFFNEPKRPSIVLPSDDTFGADSR